MMTHTEKTRAALIAQIIAIPLVMGIGIAIGWAASGDQADGVYTITPTTIQRTPMPCRCEGRSDR